MDRPYVICHMMMSLDGRIDCKMTESLPGDNEYYDTLNSYKYDATLNGRITALMECASGEYKETNHQSINKELFSNKIVNKNIEIYVDTKGSLLWDNYDNLGGLLIILSEQVSNEYLSYLDSLNVSYIVTGKDHIDLNKALDILYNQFNIKTLMVLGGGNINGGFLKINAIDEISICLGAGIDGRKNQVALFDGLPLDFPVTQLKLLSVKTFECGTIWIKYKVINKKD